MHARNIAIAVILALIIAFLIFYISGSSDTTSNSGSSSSSSNSGSSSSNSGSSSSNSGSSNSSSNSGESVCVGPDLSLYNFGTNPAAPEFVMKSCHGLVSDDKSHIFVQQSDGNLVVYNMTTAKPTWALNMGDNKIDFASGAPNTTIYQFDSNMVTYNKDGKPIWSTGTSGQKSAALAMQEDGNLVIYTDAPTRSGTSWGGPSIWNSKTAGM